jgi:acetyltransferase
MIPASTRYRPVAVTTPAAAAEAVAGAAAKSRRKPVIAAWLGDLRPSESRAYLESRGVPNFYTPENAVEAFSFLLAYRQNQAQLLEAPAALAGGEQAPAPDLAGARAIRDAALAAGRNLLSGPESTALLRAFGIDVPRSIVAATRAAALAAARALGYPVALKIHSPDIVHKSEVDGVRLDLRDDAMAGAAFDELMRRAAQLRPRARLEGVLVQPMLRHAHAREVLIGLATDPVFGPVISFGTGGVAVEAIRDIALALPPLNAMLARDLLGRARVGRVLAGYRNVPAASEHALVALLLGVSRMACALPWVKEIDLNPVFAHPGGAAVADARVLIDAGSPVSLPRYAHMAIHPYPSELEGRIVLRDGTSLQVRPIRPEDAALEQQFVHGLSARSRYQRFLHEQPELPPSLLARFTQLDYDRELALIALEPAQERMLAVGRYAPNADGETAEFALTVADAWQGRGLGSALLERLCDCARAAGYRALNGHILDVNRDMLELAARLGFRENGRDGDLVTVVRPL